MTCMAKWAHLCMVRMEVHMHMHDIFYLEAPRILVACPLYAHMYASVYIHVFFRHRILTRGLYKSPVILHIIERGDVSLFSTIK